MPSYSVMGSICISRRSCWWLWLLICDIEYCSLPHKDVIFGWFCFFFLRGVIFLSAYDHMCVLQWIKLVSKNKLIFVFVSHQLFWAFFFVHSIISSFSLSIYDFVFYQLVTNIGICNRFDCEPICQFLKWYTPNYK